MAQCAGQQIAPIETGEANEAASEDSRQDIFLDDANGRDANADPKPCSEQQRSEDEFRGTDIATEVGAARPASGSAAEAPFVADGSASGSAAPKIAPAPTMREKILALKEEQRTLRASNKAKTREIRNAERRSKRLRDKVGGLTDDDLNEVLRARAEAKALAVPKAEARAKAKASSEFPSPRKRRAV